MNVTSESKFTDADRLHVITAIRAGIAATRHHQKFGERVRKAIAALLGDKYTVSTVVNSPGDERISVWGNSCHYNQRIVVYGNSAISYRHSPNPLHWADALLSGLQREDTSDYAERAAFEAANAPLHARLATAEANIAFWQAQIDATREEASAAIAAQTIPKAATCRNTANFWTSPSKATAEKYPNVFPK